MELTGDAKTILSHAKNRKQKLDQELLEIVRLTDKTQLLHEIKNYYRYRQPRNQTCICAYLQKPIVNVKKTCAYLQLMRASSMYVRRQAEARSALSHLEEAPVDANMCARTNKLWPFISIQYELEEMGTTLDQIHEWASLSFENFGHRNHQQAKSELALLASDSQAVRTTISVCKQYIENQK